MQFAIEQAVYPVLAGQNNLILFFFLFSATATLEWYAGSGAKACHLVPTAIVLCVSSRKCG
jgi:hypothetical protein